MTHALNVNGTVERDRLADLICCALEGGSTYWCERFRPDSYPDGCSWGHEAVAHGTSFTVWHDDQTELHVENSDEHLTRTMELMAQRHNPHWTDFINENEDADTGDTFFQLLCFGEVVYG